MSNARYFADGVDFWRVLYPDGSTEGPYIKASSAKRVGGSAIKVRQRWSWAAKQEDRVLLKEWQNQPSFKLQKLVPLTRWVPVEHDESDPCAISHASESYLDWEDWSA